MESPVLLEALFVELDPLEDGFSGALVEVHRHGNRYVLLGIAPSTGNRLLRFSICSNPMSWSVRRKGMSSA